LSNLSERLLAEGDIDVAVSAWTNVRSPWEVTHSCQALGIAAHPVHSALGLLLDDHLADRGFFRWVHRPVTGPGLIPGVSLRIAGDAVRVRGPAPTMGQDNEELLHGLLGVAHEELAELAKEGVVD
jgi:crotonobetainyl-CoA:carnitine CoA-transferase CaiB-like acyl-CoA transferase